MSYSYTNITADTKLDDWGYRVLFVDASAGNITITFPPVDYDMETAYVRRMDSHPTNTVTLKCPDSPAGQLIDGASTVLVPNASVPGHRRVYICANATYTSLAVS